MLKFERRDIILVVGLLLFMVGLMPFMAPVYAVIIVTLMYFGIKFYVGLQKRSIHRDVGDGICMECGISIRNGSCPNCGNACK